MTGSVKTTAQVTLADKLRPLRKLADEGNGAARDDIWDVVSQNLTTILDIVCAAPAQCDVQTATEPAAWRYERRLRIHEMEDYGADHGWQVAYSGKEPTDLWVPVRNVTPLYAASLAVPSAQCDVQNAHDKLLAAVKNCDSYANPDSGLAKRVAAYEATGAMIFTGPTARWAQPFGETCKAGHPWTRESTRWTKGPRPQRQCRICNRLRTGFKGIYKPRQPRPQP